ncbi:MAG TPA: 5-(carboxyamino)imidazole ribonucleotide synthase [Bryobacteraceae bacterium]|nr:5-(carboxyamino)imidazole ribonucleotide synthase [Bryobacteraceae bacterium]
MKPILPGATVGVLGSGQLGRMFAIAARRMGYRVHTLSPESDTPTGQVADLEVEAAYTDLDQVREFARNVSVVTFEFENVPAETAAAAEEFAPVRPAGSVLHVTQDRLREKTFLTRAGLPVTTYSCIRSLDELRSAVARQGCPAMLKTCGFGYDGKGQVLIRRPEEADAAWDAIARCPAVLESFVDFEMEISVVGTRTLEGEFSHFGVVQNEHCRQVLDVSHAPARISEKVRREAIEIARTVLQKLDVVGVLCVEFFLAKDGRLLINELAPRPHNSGHFTFDACVTSQFEQQLRSVCGLPLGSTEQLRPAAMANLLGDLWSDGEPDWNAVCGYPSVKLHLYGKMEARPGRKMGHLTALGENAGETVRRARESLARRSS